MHALIEQHRAAIGELCQRYGVRRAEVFGSGARGVDFDPQRSDIDFLVEFDTAEGAPTLRRSLRSGMNSPVSSGTLSIS